MEPTYVCVVQRLIGGDSSNHLLWKQPLGPGVYLIFPFIDEPTIYSTEPTVYALASPNDSISVQSRDKHQLFVDISVIYAIDPNRADIVFINWGMQFDTNFVRPTIQQSVRNVFGRYTEEEIGGNLGVMRYQVQEEIKQSLTSEFYRNGFILQNAILRNVIFTNEFVATYEAIQEAQATATANVTTK